MIEYSLNGSYQHYRNNQISFIWKSIHVNETTPPILLALLSLFGEGNGTPLQYSCLENPMDGGAWWAAVHGVDKSRTRLSDFTFTFHFPALEKAVATHSSVVAWRIPRDGGALWAAICGVAQSQTRLKWLSSSTLFNPSLLIVYIQDQILAKYTLYLFLFLFHNILVSEQTKKCELCSVKCYTFDFSMCKPCCY